MHENEDNTSYFDKSGQIFLPVFGIHLYVVDAKIAYSRVAKQISWLPSMKFGRQIFTNLASELAKWQPRLMHCLTLTGVRHISLLHLGQGRSQPKISGWAN